MTTPIIFTHSDIKPSELTFIVGEHYTILPTYILKKNLGQFNNNSVVPENITSSIINYEQISNCCIEISYHNNYSSVTIFPPKITKNALAHYNNNTVAYTLDLICIKTLVYILELQQYKYPGRLFLVNNRVNILAYLGPSHKFLHQFLPYIQSIT